MDSGWEHAGKQLMLAEMDKDLYSAGLEIFAFAYLEFGYFIWLGALSHLYDGQTELGAVFWGHFVVGLDGIKRWSFAFVLSFGTFFSIVSVFIDHSVICIAWILCIIIALLI